MKDDRPEGFTRADENVSCNGFAIGGDRFFCTGHHIKPAHHQDLCGSFAIKKLERMMGFEPTTSTLARLRSTPELHPLEMSQRTGNGH